MTHHAPQPGVTVCAKSVNVQAAYTRSTRHAFLTPTRHGARVFQTLSTDARLLRPNKHQNRPRCASSAKAPAANTVQHLEPGTAGCPRNMQSLRAAACGLRRRNSPTLPLHATKQPSCTVVGPASTGHSAALTACITQPGFQSRRDRAINKRFLSRPENPLAQLSARPFSNTTLIFRQQLQNAQRTGHAERHGIAAEQRPACAQNGTPE